MIFAQFLAIYFVTSMMTYFVLRLNKWLEPKDDSAHPQGFLAGVWPITYAVMMVWGIGIMVGKIFKSIDRLADHLNKRIENRKG